MTGVTGKFQITLLKRLVNAYGIRVGDEVEVVAAGEAIAIRPAKAATAALSPEERLRHFDDAFEDGRLYGRVRVCNPFRAAVHEPAAVYGR